MKFYTAAEVSLHSKATDAWVIYNNVVCDVTGFLDGHPGGSEILLEFLGKDITEVFLDEKVAHKHSDSALSMLKDMKIGNLRVDGEKAAFPIEEEVDPTQSFGVDLRKAIIFQVGRLGKNYTKFIHKPVNLTKPARFFESDFLEFFSRTPWYVIPTLWVPFSLFLVNMSHTEGLSWLTAWCFFGLGVFIWTFLEYFLHRFIFHLDELVEFHPVAITIHFLLHGVHHFLPMDSMRLVMPPVLTILIMGPIYASFAFLFQSFTIAKAVLGGGTFGYVCYDLTHYFIHHAKPWMTYLSKLKSYHIRHHYFNPNQGFGITSSFWDIVFGTTFTVPATV